MMSVVGYESITIVYSFSQLFLKNHYDISLLLQSII